MRFFNYGRKSVFSDKSDSIDNQFRMCREFCSTRFSGEIDSWDKFSDEDFTGANTDRPGLQDMLEKIRAGLCDVLVVYQLDRLSRNVRDFSNIYALLDEKGVKFISIKESIDTSAPIGRAMMYVTVVFAQMERENTAARVDDNMRGLAKKGYWTGGNPPTGYVRQKITVDGRHHVSIVPNPDGVAYVTGIFDEFLSSGYSLQGMETAYKKAGRRTLRGCFFTTSQLYKILTSPFCVEATPAVYDYFSAKGCQMDPGSPRSSWDGSVGVMVYGRSTEKRKKHELQPPEKWLVCLGKHEPFMPAEKWLAVQAKFAQHKFVKTPKYETPLLRGALRCSCGSIMMASRKKKKDGSVSSWYYCLKRMRQGAEACPRSQIKCEKLDQQVLAVFRKIAADPAAVSEFLKKDEGPAVDPKAAQAKVSACEAKIGRLAVSLSEAGDSPARKYIISEMEKLDRELSGLKSEALAAAAAAREASENEKTAETKAAEIARLISGLDGFSASERNEIVRRVVRSLVWDGETLFLEL